MLTWSLALALAAGQAETWQLQYPLRVHPTAAAEFGANLAASHPQVCSVLARRAGGGVHVLAAAADAVPAAKVLRVCNVLAQYLDSDADGYADDPLVAQHMDEGAAMMMMWEDSEAMEAWAWSPRNWLQSFFLDSGDVQTGETADAPAGAARAVLAEAVAAPGQPFRCGCGAGTCDAALEETFHLVYDYGLKLAYPELDARSAIPHAVLGSLGESAAERSVRELMASGEFNYTDSTCWWDCQVSEAVFHTAASLNGEYARDCCRTKEEWAMCVKGDANATAQMVRQRAPGLTDALTARMPGVVRMPDGIYRPARRDMRSAGSLLGHPERPRAPIAKFRLGAAPALLRLLRRGPPTHQVAVDPRGEVEARHVR